MDSVKTFVRYQSITGNDPFDDYRVLCYYGWISKAGLKLSDYFEKLASMASAIAYAKTEKPIDSYTKTYDLKRPDGTDYTMIDAAEEVASSFVVTTSSNHDTSLLKADKEALVQLHRQENFDPTDKYDRYLMEKEVNKKSNAVSHLLQNAKQVGFSLTEIYDLEYMQAVNLINGRIAILNKQRKAQEKRR